MSTNSSTEKKNPVWVDEDDFGGFSNPDSFGFRDIIGLPPKIVSDHSVNLEQQFSSSRDYYDNFRKKYQVNTVLQDDPQWAKIVPKNEKSALDPSWLGSDDESAEMALREMTQSVVRFTKKSRFLPKRYLDFSSLRDITIGRSKGSIVDLKFHPSAPVLITASFGVVSLFKICETETDLKLCKGDPFLQRVDLPNFYVESINLYNDGSSLLVCGSRTGNTYSYDLSNGNTTLMKRPIVLAESPISKVRISPDGVLIAYMTEFSDLYVFAIKTLEHIHTFRSNNRMMDFCFSQTDSNTIYGLAENGTVHIWDIQVKGERSHFYDDGCVHATCLAVSTNDQFIACGSNTGIVNIYELNKMTLNPVHTTESGDKTPSYTLSNLTTSVSFVSFNSDNQLMAFGSNVKGMAGRMFHCSSGTVYQNFPPKPEMLTPHKLKCAQFSPNSAFFAFGTASGKCKLYRLKHFERY